MDKITRIHLAKIPYEISIDAQVDLKRYLDEIRDELDADLATEIMSDIEVRITEILSDRNIKRNDVITVKDIKAIQDQLGSPDQFSDNDAKNEPNDVGWDGSKKLLRDSDNAYIGGVASGLGAYFGIDPIFMRLLFIILTFVSGLGIILYLLLWILVPAAKSSSDKLKMSGQPVTAASLQKYRSSVKRKLGNSPSNVQSFITEVLKIICKLLRIFVSIACGLASLYILGVLGVATSFTFVYPFRSIFDSYKIDYILLGLIWLIGLSIIGFLVLAITRLWRSGSSQLKFSALTFLAILIISVAGTGAVGVLAYNHFSDEYGNGKTTTALAINNVTPSLSPNALVVGSDSNLSLNYVVSDQQIHATYEAYPGLGKPNFSIVNNAGVITVSSTNLSEAAPSCLGSFCKHIYLPIKVTLCGPSISSVSDTNGAEIWINNANFGKTFSAKAINGSSIYLNNSYATNMNIIAASSSTVQANNSSAQQTNLIIDSSSTVYAPATNNLSATLPKNCDQNGIQVLNLNYSSGEVMINGQIQSPNMLTQNSCITGISGP